MSSSLPLPAAAKFNGNGEPPDDFFEIEKSCTSLKSIGLPFDVFFIGLAKPPDKSIGVNVLDVPGIRVVRVL